MVEYRKIAQSMIIIVALILQGCGGAPIPADCKKATRAHRQVIQRMKASGRFADDLIKQHETQFMLLSTLADIGKKQEEKLERCRRIYKVIGPQLSLSKNIAAIPESNLEKLFWPPLGWNRPPANQ